MIQLKTIFTFISVGLTSIASAQYIANVTYGIDDQIQTTGIANPNILQHVSEINARSRSSSLAFRNNLFTDRLLLPEAYNPKENVTYIKSNGLSIYTTNNELVSERMSRGIPQYTLRLNTHVQLSRKQLDNELNEIEQKQNEINNAALYATLQELVKQNPNLEIKSFETYKKQISGGPSVSLSSIIPLPLMVINTKTKRVFAAGKTKKTINYRFVGGAKDWVWGKEKGQRWLINMYNTVFLTHVYTEPPFILMNGNINIPNNILENINSTLKINANFEQTGYGGTHRILE